MSDFLPIEITTQILAKLPVRSVLQFRSVCKTWRDIIDDRVSLLLHLEGDTTASGKKAPTSFFLQPYENEDDLAMYLVEQQDQQQDEDVPIFKITKINLSLPETVSIARILTVYTARGLFAVCYYYLSEMELEDRFTCYDYICNPFTGQFVKLPQILSHKSNEGCVGFGYVASTREFKLVKIFTKCIRSESEVLVFTLGKKTWKTLKNLPLEEDPWGNSVSIDTILHWGSIDKRFLLTFDIASETFGYLQLPESRSSYDPYPLLHNLNGCLSIAEINSQYSEIWVMKDYGVVESWTKFFISNESVQGLFSFEPVLFFNDTEILLISEANNPETNLLIVYNFETGTRTPIPICGLPKNRFLSWFPYCGNLLSMQSREYQSQY